MKVSANTSIASNIYIGPKTDAKSVLSSTKPVAKINTGMYKGNTSNAINMPLCLAANVSADAKAPIKVIVRVPINKETNNAKICTSFNDIAYAITGAIKLINKPLITQ